MQWIQKHIPFTILVVLCVGNIVVWSTVFSHQDQVLTVAFLDVGQGDSIFIESPSGVQMLVDGGRNTQVLTELSRVIPFYDRHIDMVIATHPDADHIGGLSHVFDRYAVSAYGTTKKESSTAVYKSLQAKVEEENAQRVTIHAGQTIDLGAGVYMDILFPGEAVDGLDTNNASIIARIRYDQTAVMLTGDAAKSIEQYLVGVYGNAMRADVLKAGHHGSKTSSAAVFLGFVAPEVGVISAGRDNRYGHPDAGVLDRFQSLGIATLSTSEAGTIIFESDGHTFTRE